MAFMNLYTKKTANPKDIDFATVGTRVKNKIPDAAIKAFQAKVTATQPKPFDFTFDKDYDTGKLQIAVKQLGFVHGWVDESFMANKQKMKVVETEIEGWKARIQQSLDALAKIHREKEELAKTVATYEDAVASDQIDGSMPKEQQATKQAISKLISDAGTLRNTTLQFWGGEPKDGVMGLMKKHGLVNEPLGGERSEAFAEYALVQQAAKKFNELFIALGKEVEALAKRNDEVGVKLFMNTQATRDRKDVLAELEEEIQKLIGVIQGYKNTDFAGVGAKTLMKEAKEFLGKTGATWTRLSANPGEIDKAAAQVQQAHERMRILGGRVVTEYSAWQKPSIPRGGNMPKFQQMLKMVYDEYMADHQALQTTLLDYKNALQKQKSKAVELVAKQVKATAKAESKTAKAQAKAVKKGR